MRIGPQTHMALNSGRIGQQISMHLLNTGKDLPGTAQQRLAGTRQFQAPGLATKQRRAQRLLQLAQPVAGR